MAVFRFLAACALVHSSSAGLSVHMAVPEVNGSELVNFSREASEIVQGLTEAFLGGEHGSLSEKELNCLSNGAGKMAGGMLDTAGRTAESYHFLKSQHRGQSLDAQYAAAQAGLYVNPGMSNPIDPLIAGLELSQRLARLMEFEKEFARECLKEDAIEQINAAVHHMSNTTFVGSRLVANGVDVVTELGKAVDAFDDKEYRGFGDNIGLAARRVLISKRGEGINALLHTPTDEEIEDVTTGLVKSIFGQGMSVQVKSDAITTYAPPPPGMFTTQVDVINNSSVKVPTAPTLIPWTLLPTTEVDVDLRQCVGGNKELFESAWRPVFATMERVAVSSSKAARGQLSAWR